jgi:transglutaminase-like putative cysteine protease
LEQEQLKMLAQSLGTIDHRQVDWANLRSAAYLIHQSFRYDYPGQIHDLHQRLVVIPPERHGSQRLVARHLEVSAPSVAIHQARDPYGNLVLDLRVEQVKRTIDFTVWILVERDATTDPIVVSAETYRDPSLYEPSRLTLPDTALRTAADQLRAGGDDPLTLAERINTWVYQQMTYVRDVTGVRTSAAAAFAARQGVCQDYAHIMLALCRSCGLPARYVSGHLLGEGGTHAWVEVLLPDSQRPGAYFAQPFDPTHGIIPGPSYLTVAVGRDYGDVAPASGTYRARHGGRLTAKKRAGITALRYGAARA